MSWQAMGAVQAQSQFVEGGAFVGFRVLLAIAWFADARGVAGKAGVREACPTQRAIAERARVHVNTVANWLPRLEAAGELAVERHGAGRGGHMVYRILLPMAGREETAQAQKGRRRAQRGSQEAGLAQRVARLEEKVEAVASLLEERKRGAARARRAERVQEKPQADGEKAQGGSGRAQERAQAGKRRPQERPHAGGRSPQVGPQGAAERPQALGVRPQERGKKATRDRRDDVADPLDPNFDPRSDPDGDPGGSRRDDIKAEGHKAGKGHKAPLPSCLQDSGRKRATAGAGFQARVKALAEVCGMDLRIAAHRRQCEQAARQLGPYAAETIEERFGRLREKGARPPGWQWYVDDWRGRDKGEQPRPRDVVSNISRERVRAERSQAGRSGGAVTPVDGGKHDPGSEADAGLGPAQIAFREFMRQERLMEQEGSARRPGW